ncbi:hypothetical protein PF008_g632 [Phytophthora fragariae]|uniref:PX domain-containing protein n=1 Tax=Phytophthora fragariae TaxID=53985 RepID=A0A6G0SMP7_9STRA|nr:hypothetical protein PF008_g632 [Phytophthora fragariae]
MKRGVDVVTQSLVEIQVDQKPSPLESLPPTPLAVQVLRFRPEEKEAATSLKRMRFVYEIETCHQETGDIYRTERCFREFKRLREALLLECRDCPECHPFVEQLRQSRLPTRQMVVFNVNKYGASRMLELTHFLRDLVRLVAQYAHHCPRHGLDIDKSVGLFLGVDSLSEALDSVAGLRCLRLEVFVVSLGMTPMCVCLSRNSKMSSSRKSPAMHIKNFSCRPIK